LDELLALYETTILRQARIMKMFAAVMVGEEAGDPFEDLKDDFGQEREQKKLLPAYAMDPTRGGEAAPLVSEEDVLMLPINLGYSKIHKDS
jgi:hypothetical protein